MLTLDQLKGKSLLTKQETLDLLENSIILLTSWGVSTYLINRVKIIKEKFKGRRLQGKVAKEYLFIMKLGIIASGANSSVIGSISRLADNFMGEISGNIVIELVATLIDSSGETIAPPTNLVATPVSDTEIDLTWDDNSSNETGFEVYRATTVDGVYTLINTTAANVESYSDTGLTAGTTYYYKIRTKKSTLFSVYTSTVSATTEEAATDYSVLDPYFDHLSVIEESSVFNDLAGTIPVGNYDAVRNITDRKGGGGITWQSNDSVRVTYMHPKWGAAQDLLRPHFNNPDDDIPFIFLPNMIDVQLYKAVTSHASPNTVVLVIRKKRSVFDENVTPYEMIGIKEKGSGIFAMGNNISGQVDVGSSSLMSEDVWTVLWGIDNGASSHIRKNNVQTGSNCTLTAGTLTAFGVGTSSHVLECDIAMIGVYKGVHSSGDRIALQALIEGLFPIGLKPTAPFARNISINFDGTDTFTVSYTYDNGGTGIAEDTSLREVEWFMLTPGTSPDGWTGLDSQAVVPFYNSLTLVRAQHPTFFPSPGGATSQVCARVKAYGVGGANWTGTPLRCSFANDNILGTTGTPVPSLLSASVENSDKDRVVLTFTGGTGTLDNTSGNVADFKVYINDVQVSLTSIAFPGGNVLHITMTNPIISSDTIRVSLEHGGNALQDNGNHDVEQFITGPVVHVDNNVLGTQIVGINYYHSNMYSSGIFKNNYHDTDTTIANLKNSLNVNTGYTWTRSGAPHGYTNNGSPTATTNFPTTVLSESHVVYQLGTTTITYTLSGGTEDQLVDIVTSLLTLAGDVGGAGTLTITGKGSPIVHSGINPLTPQEISDVGVVFPSSGNITIQLVATGGGKQIGITGMKLTIYPPA